MLGGTPLIVVLRWTRRRSHASVTERLKLIPAPRTAVERASRDRERQGKVRPDKGSLDKAIPDKASPDSRVQGRRPWPEPRAQPTTVCPEGLGSAGQDSARSHRSRPSGAAVQSLQSAAEWLARA